MREATPGVFRLPAGAKDKERVALLEAELVGVKRRLSELESALASLLGETKRSPGRPPKVA